MKHWSISRKMATLVAVPLALIVVISVVAFFSLRTLTSTTNELYNEKMKAIRLLDEIRLNNREVEAGILELILDKSEEGVKKNTARIDELRSNNKKLMKEYKTLPSNKKLKDMVSSYESMLDGYGKQMENIQRKAVDGNSEEAYFLYSMNLKNITQEINVNTLAKMAEVNTKMAKDLYEEAEKEATITTIIMIVAAIAAMLLTAVIGFVVMRSITKPIVALKGLMSRVRDGDLRVQSDYEARDEIGQLMSDFNAMTANLQQLIVDMKTKSDSLSMSAAQMSASSEHTSKAAEQITELIAESTTALDEQMSIADQSATMMEEMVMAIQRIAEAYQEVAESSSDAMRQAETGDRNVKRIMDQMDTISANSESTSTLVAELGERTKAISDIVGVITSIADQTNLLALNAAIEAARAGEHGKGFAVVAAEVRKLAEQSRNSAESIVGLITQIVSDTDRAITAMRAGNEQARSGAAIAKEAGEGFGLILEAVRRSAEQVHEVSAISEEMTASVEQMASTVQTMRSSSEHSLSGAQTISGSTEEQMAAIQQISASAQHVYDLSQQLQQSAAQFIVDDVDVKPKRQPVYPTVVTEGVVEERNEVVEEMTEEVGVSVVEDVIHDEQLTENEVHEEERELVKQ